MSKKDLGLAAALLLALLPGAGADAARRSADDSAAVWIERMSEALVPTASARARVTLETGDREGERVIHMNVSRHSDDSSRRTLIELTEPEVAEGTVYEVVARGEETLERWEYVPAVRRLHRSSGILRTDPFLGTEFTYEDLDFAAPVERAQGEVDRVREGARELVRVTSDSYHDYGRVETLIDPRTALPLRVSFYDGTGALVKVQEFDRIRTVQGHRVPTLVVMRDLATGETSRLRFREIEFDVPVPREISELAAVPRPITAP